MNFKKLCIASFLTAIGSGVIGIVLAYQGIGVWALVAQQFSNSLLLMVSLGILVPWRLRYSAFPSNGYGCCFPFGSEAALFRIYRYDLYQCLWSGHRKGLRSGDAVPFITGQTSFRS